MIYFWVFTVCGFPGDVLMDEQWYDDDFAIDENKDILTSWCDS